MAIQVTAPISGTVARIEKQAGGWRVTKPVTGTAQASECESIAYNLSHLMVRRTIENPTEEDKRAYGLITPTYTIVVQVGSRTLHLDVGARHPGGAYYVRPAYNGPGPVLMVPDYTLEEVLRILERPPLMAP